MIDAIYCVVVVGAAIMGRFSVKVPPPMELREPPRWSACYRCCKDINETVNKLLSCEDLITAAQTGRAVTATDQYKTRSHTLSNAPELLLIERDRLRATLLTQIDELLAHRVYAIRTRVCTTHELEEGRGNHAQ